MKEKIIFDCYIQNTNKMYFLETSKYTLKPMTSKKINFVGLTVLVKRRPV